MKDKKIGVLMGGVSKEREVSLRSGSAVLNAVRSLGYGAAGIDVGPDLCEALGREKPTVAFLALHGGHGEDGSIQGFLEVLGIPYTGSGVLASALAMDKAASKVIFKFHNIPVPEFAVVETCAEGLNAAENFALPVVVKPRKEGSSIGVSIVKKKEELDGALMDALSFGGGALIEQYIAGREVQIGILANKILGGVEVRPKHEFYDYRAKYTPGMTEYILPPDLDEAVYGLAKETAYGAHRALGCSGATRVDLIVDRAGKPYVLEVNTIPGMTETSLLPKIAKTAGFDFPALIEEILKDALKGR